MYSTPAVRATAVHELPNVQQAYVIPNHNHTVVIEEEQTPKVFADGVIFEAEDVRPHEEIAAQSNQTPVFYRSQSIFSIPNFSRKDYAFLIISGLINGGIWAALIYIFFQFIVLDVSGNVKPFKAACFSPGEMEANICFFSAGQLSKGLISFGQVNIGLLCIGQVNIGLLVSIGQISAGIGFSIGQVATGWYVYLGQIAFAMYRIRYAQFGLQFLKCFRSTEQERFDAVVACGC